MKPKKPIKKKSNAGRPTKYTLEFCVAEIKEIWGRLKADRSTDDTKIKYRYITLHDLIRDKPYSRQRISEWFNIYRDNSEFSDTFFKIKDELENRLFKLGLSNKVNAFICRGGLSNYHDWKDKTDITSDGEKIQALPPPVIQVSGKTKNDENRQKETS